jgi:hypothetical protein
MINRGFAMNNKYIFILPQRSLPFKEKERAFRFFSRPPRQRGRQGKDMGAHIFPTLLNHTCYFFVKRCGNFRRCAETGGKKLL